MSANPNAPRAVLELQPDGTITIETYINGARSIASAPRGFLETFAREALERQNRAVQAQDTARASASALAEAALRRKVYFTTRYTHGEAFADKYCNSFSRKGTAALERQKRVNDAMRDMPLPEDFF